MPFPLYRYLPISFALLLLVLAGCAKKESAPNPTSSSSPIVIDQQPVQGDWVIQRIDSDPDSLNPITGQDTNGDGIRYPNVIESLLFINNDTLKLEPLLAESYEISPDQLTYTFHLRHGVKWHDGTPFTADDVKFSYDRVQDPKVDAAHLRVYLANIKSCEVLDPYTVRFIATERYFKTLESLGTNTLPIIPKHIFEKGDPDFNKHSFARNPIGTGPYKFVRWDTGFQIVLERNDDYWGGTTHYPKRLVYEILQEPYVAAQLMKKGEIDVFDGVSPVLWKHDFEGSHSMSQLHEIVYLFPAYNYLGFNLRKPLFGDIRVRHAIDLLLPRDEILAQIYLNQYGGKASGYDPPSSPNYNQDVLPTPYDPALALQLLTEAGWKNDHGDGLLYKNGQALRFTLNYPGGNINVQKIAELIQESLHHAGIDLKLSSLEFAQLIAKVDDWNFDSVISGWSLDLNGDPSQLWASPQADLKKSSNFIGYKNPAADKLMNEGRLEYDEAKRAVLYRQLHKIIHDDYPVCFLFNPHVILVVSNRYQNVRTFASRPCFDIGTWWVPRSLQKYGN